MAMRKVNPKKGDVFEIPLDGKKHGYGHVLGVPFAGFYAIETDENLELSKIVTLDVAFRVDCLSDRLRDGRWRIIGNVEPGVAMRAPAKFWRQTAPGFIFLSEWSYESGGDERRATPEEIVGLEKHGIWDSRDVEERLKMFLRGEPCPWVKIAGRT